MLILQPRVLKHILNSMVVQGETNERGFLCFCESNWLIFFIMPSGSSLPSQILYVKCFKISLFLALTSVHLIYLIRISLSLSLSLSLSKQWCKSTKMVHTQVKLVIRTYIYILWLYNYRFIYIHITTFYIFK